MSARARLADPRPSHDAAARVDTRTLELAVLHALICNPDGLTTHEIEDWYDKRFTLVSISPRMKPLAVRGWIVRTTERRDGSTVWRKIDCGLCPHPSELFQYMGEQPVDLFTTKPLVNCRVCGTSLLRDPEHKEEAA